MQPASYEVLDEFGLLVAKVPSRAAAEDLIWKRGLEDAEIVPVHEIGA